MATSFRTVAASPAFFLFHRRLIPAVAALLLFVFCGGLQPETARAEKRVEIGAGETRAMTEILVADPKFSFNDVFFTGNDPNRPGILLLDRGLPTPGGQLKFTKGHGTLSIDSGITLTLEDIDKPGHQQGGWMRGIEGIPVRIDGSGVLWAVNNRVEGDASVIYADSSVYIGDSAYFADNASHYYYHQQSAINKRPTLSSGGVIYAGQNVTIGKDVRFISNRNEGGFGGAIYAGGSVTLGTNALFSGNESRQTTYRGKAFRSPGGAIWAGKDVTFAGGATLTENSASSGGAVYSEAGAVTVNGSATFSGNKALGGYNFGNNNGGYGGAIYAEGQVAVHSTGTFSGNTAVSSGGAVYSNGSVLFTSAMLSGNEAVNTVSASSSYPKDAYGGAVYAAGSITIGSVVAENNHADSNNSSNDDGGVLYAKSGNVSINISASFDKNKAQGRGGAIAAGAGNISVTGGVFTDNWSSGHGGALFAAKGTVTLGANSSFTGNASDQGGGGAVYAPGGVSGSAGLILRDNTAQKGGGAIWSGSGVSLLSDTVLDANISNFKGGAVFATGNLGMGMRSSVTGNEARGSGADGGALYSETGTVTLDDGAVLSGNEAGRDGGAVWAKTGVTIDPGAAISGNTAGGKGGAVFSEQGTISFGDRLVLSGNSAVGNGGAVYGTGKVVFGKNVTLEGNKTTGSSSLGGAVLGVDITFGDNAAVRGNESGGDGGALFTNSQVKFGANAVLSGNTSRGGKGGAVYAYAGAAFTNGAVLEGNTAKGDGGAVHSEASSLSFGTRASLAGNTATTGDGGALYAFESITLGAEAFVSGNSATAGSGGAIYAGKGATLGGGTFSGNTATTGDGGALYVTGDLSVTGPASFTNNTAGGKGGALYVNNGNLSLHASGGDIVFSGNTAKGASSAVYMNSSSKTLTLSATKGNSILFGDTLESAGALTLAINSEATDTGVVRFLANAATPGATTMVSYGTLELNDGVTWGAGALGYFSLQSGATLAVNGSATINAAAALYRGSQLSFGLAGKSYGATLLTLAGTPTIPNGNSGVQIDLLSLSENIVTPGSYTLVAGWKGISGYNPNLTVRGEAVSGAPRLANALSLRLESGTGNLMLDVKTLENLDLTWKNLGGTWDMASRGKWKDGASADRYFLHGDRVTFGSFWNDADTVTVAAGGVVVGDMTVKGKYVFLGGTIEANRAASTLAAATGTLTVAEGAVADFSGITGSNTFEKVDLSGELVLGQPGHLGTTFKHVVFSGANPTLRFVNNAFVFDGEGSDAQRIVHDVDGQLFTLNAEKATGLAFLNSSAATGGGAVFTKAGTLDVYGKTFFTANRSGADGGAISAGMVKFFNNDLTVLRGNSAAGSGGAVHAVGYVKFGNNTLLSENTAKVSGGGVYATDMVQLGANSVVMRNTAETGSGGGIRARSASVDKGGFIYANKAGEDGGAIWSDGAFTSTESNYVSNTAKGAGGAIRASGTVTLTGDTFSSNTAGTDGGAVHTTGRTELKGAVTLSSNTAKEKGGALRTGSLDGQNATASFERNSATDGGAVYSDGVVTMGKNVSAVLNTATTGSGGAFYAAGPITLGDNAVLRGNSAKTSGGALSSDKEIEVGANSVLSLNSAYIGGAVYSSEAVNLGSGSRLLLNTATHRGGAVYHGGDDPDLLRDVILGKDVTISGNTAVDHGGGIYAEGAVRAGDNLVMALNKSGDQGGAIRSKGMILGANASFAANKAAHGGAVYNYTDSLTVGARSLFRGNSASMSGGAIFSANGAVTLKIDALLTGNSAGADGGAIAGSGGGFKLVVNSGSVFSDNSAKSSGGAIHVGEGSVTLNALTGDIAFINNTAKGAPSAIHLTDSAGLSMNAAKGRFIYMDDPLSSGSGTSKVNVNKEAGSTGTIRFSKYNSVLREVETTVYQGVFELADGAGYGSKESGSFFTLKDSARLLASGSKNVRIGAESIAFEAKSALLFNPAAHVGESAILTLDSVNPVNLNTDSYLSISSVVRKKGAVTTLVKATAGNNFSLIITDDNLYYKMIHVPDTRLNGLLTLDTSEPGFIRLVQLEDIVNHRLTWTGNESEHWNLTDFNWKDRADADMRFFDGDTVFFDNSGKHQDSVTVMDEGVSVASMTVSGGNYTFKGGEIAGAGSSLLGDNTLHLTGTASAAFETDLRFTRGYDIGTQASMTFRGSAISGPINNRGRFAFDVRDTENPLVFSDGIQGKGNLIKTGAGTLELGGSTWQNSFTVDAGTLAFSGPDTVFGTANGLRVNSSGTLRIGNIGRMQSDLRMAGGSRLDIAGETMLALTGKADIADSIAPVISYTGFLPDRIYPLLHAAKIIRPFTERELDYGQGTGVLMRNGNYLILATGNPDDLWPKGHTYNQRSTLRAIQTLPAENGLRDVLMLDEGLAEAAADLLSGEGHASTAHALIERSRAQMPKTTARISWERLNAMLAAHVPGNGRTVAELETKTGPSPATTSRLWMDGGGARSTFDDDGNAAKTELYGPEFAAGVDFRNEDGWLFGVSGQVGVLTAKVKDRRYEADVNAYGITAYGGKELPVGPGNVRMVLGGTYTYYDVEAERSIKSPAFNDSLESDYGIQTWQLFGEAAYGFALSDTVALEPYAALAWNYMRNDSFSEEGGDAALRSSSRTHDDVSSHVGLRAQVKVGDRVSVSASAGWAHIYGDNESKSTFRFAGGSDPFSIKGYSVSRDSLSMGLNADIKITDSLSFSVGYNGMLGDKGESHGGQAMLVWKF